MNSTRHDAITVTVPTQQRMHALGLRLTNLLEAGDLVVLDGELGAGKTTLTQGIGEGLGVRGPVTSPTFVLARTHPSLAGGPALIHVDAYRLSGWDEVEDLDLVSEMSTAVTVVEWGGGVATGLATAWLWVLIDRPTVTNDDVDMRTVTIGAQGARWADVDLGQLRDEEPGDR
ncbi:MAG TPA: tRNA (adenosine(37)-N6)-threonylcarbamoyltransferase complex ATPase subunit type 1 TsaE [Jiangellaceae bacterium]|nr:tRNA (adenosine(37)-N6)-threonylcarbamoyltransferase complex ATPase subunit type 1 TsaE [Jiangellaceae bacterium]